MKDAGPTDFSPQDFEPFSQCLNCPAQHDSSSRLSQPDPARLLHVLLPCLSYLLQKTCVRTLSFSFGPHYSC